MALTQKGAGYINRFAVKEGPIKDALDDLANQIRAATIQGNFSSSGTVSPPTSPTAVAVTTTAAGLKTVQITDANAEKGVLYRLQYSTSPNFTDPVSVDLGEVPQYQVSLPGQSFYWKVAKKFPASDLSPWVYFGSSVAPQVA